MDNIYVPESFVQIGFSGLFHTTCQFSDSNSATLTKWQAKAPCLVHGDTWLLLRINEAGLGVLVRRDDCAVVEALTHPDASSRASTDYG